MRQYSALLLRKKLVKTWKKLPPELQSRLAGVNYAHVVLNHDNWKCVSFVSWVLLVTCTSSCFLIFRIKATLLQCLTQEKQWVDKISTYLIMTTTHDFRHLVLRSVAHTVSCFIPPLSWWCILILSLPLSPTLSPSFPPFLPSTHPPSLSRQPHLHPFLPPTFPLSLPPGQCDSTAWVFPRYMGWTEPVHSRTLQQPRSRTQRGRCICRPVHSLLGKYVY